MSTSLKDGTLTAGNANRDKEFNEFARIQGLEPTMQRWLRESLNVYTVADLATLSVNRVLSRLEDEGKTFPPDQIERWITQAQSFAAAQTSWQTFATFVVSLQTRQIDGQTEQRTIAYFVEADRRKIWSGIECNGVYELMLDQLKQAFQLEPEVNVPMASESKIESKPSDVSPSEPEPVAATTGVELAQPELELDTTVRSEPEIGESLESTTEGSVAPKAEPELEPGVTEPLTLEITQLKFWQPPEAEKPEPEKAMVVNMTRRSLPGMLHKEEPFQIEVTFQSTGTRAIDLIRKPLHCHAQCFIQNRETREKLQIENSFVATFTDGALACTCRLPEMTLQQPGLYRLQVITQLDGGHASPNLFELPFVQVI